MTSEVEWVDDTFYVKEQRWGTWVSYGKDDQSIITSLTQEQCISATRYILKGRQEGFTESQTYEGQVGGKL